MPIRAKTRDVLNHHQDSSNWDLITPREGDVVAGNWAKAGVTWLQQIILQLQTGGSPEASVLEISTWPDWWTTLPKEELRDWVESKPTPRLFKTHLPADSLNLWPRVKYVYIGRDVRDVCWSFYPHLMNYTQDLIDRVNSAPHRDWAEDWGRPTVDISAFYDQWIENDGAPYWPFWSNVRSWWDSAHELPNVMLVHHQMLKDDTSGQIRRIADFLDVEIDPAAWPKVLEHCSFHWMKAHKDQLLPTDSFVDKGESFMNRGVNGRWRDLLSPEQIARADEVAAIHLTPDCARWLKTGEGGD
jgi:aryl sulfotransferase